MNTQKHDKNIITALTTWFVNCGGWIHPSVHIVHQSPPLGYSLRVRDNHTVPAGSRVISCPHTSTISVLDLDQALPPWPADFQSQWENSPDVLTRFFLMEQRLQGQQSFWEPYLRMLPGPEEMHTPIWYDEDDCAWIEGTNLAGARLARLAGWKREFDVSMKLLESWADDGGLRLHLYTLCGFAVFVYYSFSGG